MGAVVGAGVGWVLARHLVPAANRVPAREPEVPEDLLPTDSASYLAADLSIERRFDELANLLVQTAAARTGLPCALAMREKPGDPLRILSVSSTNDPRLVGIAVDIDSPAGRAVQHALPVVAGSEEKVMHLAPGERRRGQHGGISVPVVQGGLAYGALFALGVPDIGTNEAVSAMSDLSRRFGPALVPAYQARLEADRARTDDLTGLPNRRRLSQEMGRRELARAVLMIADLDHFKRINDTHGHQAGDAALKHVARVLEDTVRRREGDLAARIGGEEFAVWLPMATADAGVEVAERLRRAVESTPLRWQGQEVPLTISCGVAAYPIPIRSLENLQGVADAALYRAKREGRNRVIVGRGAADVEAASAD